MSGDYSRIAYDPRQDYGSVLLQQGRPLADRDWNDLVLAAGRRDQAGTLDTNGRMHISAITPDAFRITSDGAGSLLIGPGRLYLDGLLVENHGTGAPKWDAALAEAYGDSPVPFMKQPYRRNIAQVPTTGGPYVIYLDVWQREVTQFTDPDLVEKAIGVDSTTRLQTAWQVKFVSDVGASLTCATPLDNIPAWISQTAQSAGRLSIATAVVPGDANPCLVPATGGYKGLENQLYRIEIHEGGPLGTATFKWSRENASVEARVTRIIDLNHIVVESVGKDNVLRFSDGDWIEVLDDWSELAGVSGQLVRIAVGGGVDDATRTITLDQKLVADLFPADAAGNLDPSRHTRIRRWDQKGKILDKNGAVLVDLSAANSKGAITIPSGAVSILIEDGIVATFSIEAPGPNTEFRPRDYWLFAARSTDASVELLDKAPPRGVHHHYAKLAIYTPPSTIQDCRPMPTQEEISCCTAVVTPGQSIQAAIDSLPDNGGCVCLKPGIHKITAPLRITRSNVTLAGESLGAVVRREGAVGMLAVSGASVVANATIENIRFTIAGEQPQVDTSAVITLTGCSDATVRNCSVETDRNVVLKCAAISNSGSTDTVIQSCELLTTQIGVLAAASTSRMRIVGCDLILAEQSSPLAFATLGIVANDVDGPLHIEGNRIEGYMIGVALNKQPLDGVGDCGAAGSLILNNRIIWRTRSATAPGGLAKLFGVDVASPYTTLRGNHIAFNHILYVGIRLAANDCVAEGNWLQSLQTVAEAGKASFGIQIGVTGTAGENQAARSTARGNLSSGAQFAVYVDGAANAYILGNNASVEQVGGGDLESKTAVWLKNALEATVSGNHLSGHVRGIWASNGTRNRIIDNRIGSGVKGIVADRETSLEAHNNTILLMRGPGFLGTGLAGVTRLHGETFRCCQLELGGEAFARSIYIATSDGEVAVEGCTVMDTGVDGQGAIRAQPAIGIECRAPNAHIHGNIIGFSKPPQSVADNCALRLYGPGGAGDLPVASVAQVVDNKFSGPGINSLVSLGPNPATFGRIIFNNNFCDHLTEIGDRTRSTVSLTARAMAVVGNNVRNKQNFAPFNFNESPVVSIGNVTNGGPSQGASGLKPMPEVNFNITTIP